MTVSLGDTIVFNWSGIHNVYIHPTGDCSQVGAIFVGTETGASYTFIDSDVGDLEFVCDVGAHCENGMRVTITVIAAGTTAAPVTAAPVTAAPVTAAPVTAAPVTTAPVTAAPVTAAPVSPAPVTGAPVGEETTTLPTLVAPSSSPSLRVTGAPSVSDAPSVSPAPSRRSKFPFCFSGSGMVETQEMGAVEMANLQLGDRVLVAGNKYEQIYSFGHRNVDATGVYLQVHSQDTQLPIELSPDHMIQLEGGSFVPASHLEVGSKRSRMFVRLRVSVCTLPLPSLERLW